ncbi:hypothetical protein GA0115242_12908 [Streptomyces sp. SolWspMP-5a-2]|nr:cell wall protein [Streptomyces sp. SID4950]SCE29666.1 hypothetical protein GA0115242_12908 [Streptomyces sp. SolWspMP-5a-2]
MRIRRAMRVAAATAVIAPLALLSAPLASADEEPSQSASPSVSESVTEEPTEVPTSEPASPTASETGLPSETPAPSESVTSSPSAGASPTGSASPEPSESAEPTPPDVPFCEDLDEDYSGAKVSADIKGLPGKIVAGDGFHAFQLAVRNDSKAAIDGVAFYAEIENYELDEAKYLSPYVDLEFKNPQSGSWERIGDNDWAGDYFFYVDDLKPGATETVSLRVSIGAKAPAGDAYSFGSGAYVDDVEGQECIAEGWAQYDFEVLKPGAANPDPGTATPNEGGDKGSVKRPQGDVSALPTGNLAATGAGSALPVIGLVGGVAVVAGAGAVLAVRRRRGSAVA